MKTGTKQTVNLALDTIPLAIKREKLAARKEKKRVAAELQLHSDQGAQYTSQAYLNLTKKYNITPSKSRKSLRQCNGRKFLLNPESRASLPEQTKNDPGSR